MPWPRLLTACVLLPPLLTAALIARFGVDLPYWDEWVHLQALVRFEAGSLTVAELFAQYNESRKPFPRLLLIALAYPAAGDQRAQMAVTWCLAAATLGLIWLLARQSGLHRRPGTFATLLLTASVLLFSWTQWQNWLWGIQFVCLLPMACLCTVLAVCGSRRFSPVAKTAVAAAACTLATYSFASGMLIWPLCGLALWRTGRASPRSIAAFATAGVVAVGAYFVGYQRPSWTPDWSEAVSDPVRFAAYMAVLAGGGLVPAEASATAHLPRLLMPILLGSGILLLAVVSGARALYRAVRHDDDLAVPWALMAAYSVAAMAVAALGRSPFGLDTALLSRYATFTLPAPIAAIAMLALLPHSRPVRVARTTLAGVVITSAIMSSAMLLPRIDEVHRRQLTGRAMLTFCLTAPDATQTTFVADWPQHPLIVPTAVTLSAAGLMSPAVSTDGDPVPLLRPNDPPARARLRGTTLLLDDPDIHTVLVVDPVPRPTVVRVLHAVSAAGKATPYAEIPPLPPGADLIALTGADLRGRPIRLVP